ncbi:helix-turn-helix domain-containing protein [Tropicimonas sp. TH_r6]|uniref:MarR family transcriptional regulator n=1 Tax=Tropicimonas sp. TH_r6 TaxID=3082085 RepID=UPI00295331F2|nr:MarR family transcriptional regulator [Tropicimonas sp. TH_r6]MDV7142815.1 helix-turn-helix domain-containing protein [Tropicimonas sp. TH_r6]
MNPTERTLQVLEYIMAAGPEPVKQTDIARHCGLSPSTLNRIVKSLSDWGYLFRTSEKYCVRNFRLERNVPMSQTYLAKLDSTMKDMSERLGVSAEVIVVAGHELLWHSKTGYPDPNVVIRASVGFRRSLYELDVLSQLYLSRLTWDDVQASFYTDGFFETLRKTGQATHWLPAPAVRDTLDGMRSEVFAADPEGNHVGIRRCATVVEDPNGKFLHLLALAEPDDRPNDDIEKYKDALLAARAELSELGYAESSANRLAPKHHALPLRGG